MLSELLVFVTHTSALVPLHEPILVVLRFIAPQVILDFAHLSQSSKVKSMNHTLVYYFGITYVFEVEVVPAEFEVDDMLLVLTTWVE